MIRDEVMQAKLAKLARDIDAKITVSVPKCLNSLNFIPKFKPFWYFKNVQDAFVK